MTGDEKLENVQDLVTEIAKALVDRPEEVEVEVMDGDEDDTVLELYVAPEDVGKVIGKQGRTARSLRTLLNAVGTRHHRRYTLEIIEDDEDEDNGDFVDNERAQHHE